MRSTDDPRGQRSWSYETSVVEMLGCENAMHPEFRGDAIDAKLREDVLAEIPVELIFLRKMAEVLHKKVIVIRPCFGTEQIERKKE